MTTFEIIEAATPAPELPDSCGCQVTGPRTVLFSIDAGSSSLLCATCRRSLAEWDLMELVSLAEVPMTLTHHVQRYSGPDGTEYDEWYDLAPVAEAESVQELAEVVDRIRSIGGLGS